jgi:hypothetical protein
MAKHKHVVHLSEVPVDRITAPEGSVLAVRASAWARKSVRKTWATVFLPRQRVKETPAT